MSAGDAANIGAKLSRFIVGMPGKTTTSIDPIVMAPKKTSIFAEKSTPLQLIALNKSMNPIAVAILSAAPACGARYFMDPITSIAIVMFATIHDSQPKTNPVVLPKACFTNSYAPPAFGNMETSSAKYSDIMIAMIDITPHEMMDDVPEYAAPRAGRKNIPVPSI